MPDFYLLYSYLLSQRGLLFTNFYGNYILFLVQSLNPGLIIGSNLIHMFILVVLLFFELFLPGESLDHRLFRLPLLIVDGVEFFLVVRSFRQDYHSVGFVSHADVWRSDVEGRFYFLVVCFFDTEHVHCFPFAF